MKTLHSIVTSVFTSLFILSSINLYAQDEPVDVQKRNKFIGATWQAGTVLPTNDFVKGENASGEPIDYYQSFRLEFGWQTMGDKLWEQINGLPHFGIGFYAVDFFNSTELGTPSALYGFFAGPIKSFRRWSIDYQLGLGLTYNWQPYNADLNPYNYAIGSYKTVYIDAGVVADIPLGKHFNMQYGFSFTHFSNGASSLPNLGINLAATKIGLKYNFGKQRPEIKDWKIPKYDDDNEFFFAVSFGSKQIEYDTSRPGLDQRYYDVNYLMTTLSFVYHRQLNHSIKVGGGLDLSYDGTLSAVAYVNGVTNEPVELPFSDKIGLGVMGSFEWVIARMSVLLQPGYHVIRKEVKGQTPPLYQRAGVKYHIFPNTFAGIYIKAYNFSVADYIEWTIGHRIKWK